LLAAGAVVVFNVVAGALAFAAVGAPPAAFVVTLALAASVVVAVVAAGAALDVADCDALDAAAADSRTMFAKVSSNQTTTMYYVHVLSVANSVVLSLLSCSNCF
jgi:molybdopterin biosynthesis enzyme